MRKRLPYPGAFLPSVCTQATQSPWFSKAPNVSQPPSLHSAAAIGNAVKRTLSRQRGQTVTRDAVEHHEVSRAPNSRSAHSEQKRTTRSSIGGLQRAGELDRLDQKPQVDKKNRFVRDTRSSTSLGTPCDRQYAP